MAWASLAAASRHLSVALRTQTPRNIAQGKRLMAGIGSKGPFAETLKHFASPEKTGALQQKVSEMARPLSERAIGLQLALMFTASAATAYFWTRESKDSKKEDLATKVANAGMVLPQMASLINNQAAPLTSNPDPVTKPVPCEPCAHHSPEANSSESAAECEETEIPSILTPTPCVVVRDNPNEPNEVIIPETVSNINAPEVVKPSEPEPIEMVESEEPPTNPIRKRRRRSRAAKQQENEEE